MNRKLAVLAVVMILIAMSVHGSVAYFTAENTATNVITTGSIKIELVETAVDGNGERVPFENVINALPASEVSKIVEVKNTGESTAYIRVKVDKTIELAEGREGQIDLSLVSFDLNTAYWTEKDGYYYYSEAVAPDELTKPLFTKVIFDKRMDNLYQKSTVTILVDAQATQTANNGANALEAAGWP